MAPLPEGQAVTSSMASAPAIHAAVLYVGSVSANGTDPAGELNGKVRVGVCI